MFSSTVDVDKLELAFRLDDYDSIYRQLTANNIGGPELLGRSSAEDQLYIRAFAAIASSPEEGTPVRDSRRDSVLSILSLIDSRSLPSKLSAEFSEYFNVKSGLLDKSFDLSSVDDISSEGLDRLTEVSRMLGDSTSEELKTANSYKTNSSSLTSYLESQNFIDNSGQILDSTGNPLEVDGEVPTVDSYESLKNLLIDSNTNTLASEFVENESFTPSVAKSFVIAEITDYVVSAASSDVHESISRGLNSLLVAATEIDTDSPDAKSEAQQILALTSSLNAIIASKPLYKINEETGDLLNITLSLIPM